MIDTPQGQETLAELAESTASALLAFAQAVRPASDRDDDGTELASLGLGRRQQEIAALAGLDTDEGLSTSEVAREIDYDAANTTPRCTPSPRAASRKVSATPSTPAGDSRRGIGPLTRTSRSRS